MLSLRCGSGWFLCTEDGQCRSGHCWSILPPLARVVRLLSQGAPGALAGGHREGSASRWPCATQEPASALLEEPASGTTFWGGGAGVLALELRSQTSKEQRRGTSWGPRRPGRRLGKRWSPHPALRLQLTASEEEFLRTYAGVANSQLSQLPPHSIDQGE